VRRLTNGQAKSDIQVSHGGHLDGIRRLCKRYQGSVGSKEIRDFRGALEGRATQGLFITTGTFTSEAQKEATRDGARPIELIDGDSLCELLEELQLGVKTSEKIVKEMTINPEFFEEL